MTAVTVSKAQCQTAIDRATKLVVQGRVKEFKSIEALLELNKQTLASEPEFTACLEQIAAYVKDLDDVRGSALMKLLLIDMTTSFLSNIQLQTTLLGETRAQIATELALRKAMGK